MKEKKIEKKRISSPKHVEKLFLTVLLVFQFELTFVSGKNKHLLQITDEMTEQKSLARNNLKPPVFL